MAPLYPLPYGERDSRRIAPAGRGAVPKTNETLLAHAKAMRSTLTPAEQKLWQILRSHRFKGVKFSRQIVIGSFIVDFAARMRKLVVELDGDTHGAQIDYDAARTAKIEALGYRVIRFTNSDVMGYLEGVARVVEIALGLETAPLPAALRASVPLPIGERES